jgi:hypothetical protein
MFSWKMHFESEVGQIGESDQIEKLSRGTVIAGDHIQPNTWYAFYVQTKLVNHPGARNAISRIQFIKTLYGSKWTLYLLMMMSIATVSSTGSATVEKGTIIVS